MPSAWALVLALLIAGCRSQASPEKQRWPTLPRRAFDELTEHHRASDYAAWKYGYVTSVLDLLVTARATSPVRLLGCDMPTETQALAAGAGPLLPSLRELHCLSALADATRHDARPKRVAMLWGARHARTLPRFLPPSTEVLTLYVVGFRAGAGTLEARLAPRVALADPMLVPLDARGEVAALVYSDDVLGVAIDRVHEVDLGTAAPVAPLGSRVTFELPPGAALTVGEHPIPMTPEGRASIELARGADRRYRIQAAGVRFAGVVHVAEGAEVTLRFDAEHRSIASTERGGTR